MSRATLQMRNFARRLIAYETSGSEIPLRPTLAPFPVCEKLRTHLTPLIGVGGFQAILSRARALAAADIQWLHGVEVKADASFGGLEVIHHQLEPVELFEGEAVLLAHLLSLLVAFVGEPLTLRLVREAWPKAPLDNLDFEKEGKHEAAP